MAEQRWPAAEESQDEGAGELGNWDDENAYTGQPAEVWGDAAYPEGAAIPGVIVQAGNPQTGSGSVPFCNGNRCCISCGGLVIGYVFLATVGGLLTMAVFPLGLLILAVGPPMFLVWYFTYWVYRPATVPRQVFFSGQEAVLLMLPLLGIGIPAQRLLKFATGIASDKYTDEGISGEGVLAAFIFAFFFASLPEELLKLLVVSRLAPPSRLRGVDPRGLIVYGMAGAAAFATIENILYVMLSQKLGVGILRAVVSIPGHINTGAIMGAKLALDAVRARGPWKDWDEDEEEAPASDKASSCSSRCAKRMGCLPTCGYSFRVLFIPVCLHGCFNFFLFVGTQAKESRVTLLLMVVSVFMVIIGLLYARYLAKFLSLLPQEDMQMLVSTGVAPLPEFRPFLGLCGGWCGGRRNGVTEVALAPNNDQSVVVGRPVEVSAR